MKMVYTFVGATCTWKNYNCYSVIRYLYNNDGQPTKRNTRWTNIRWAMACFSYTRRMCIQLKRHMRKVSYGQQRKREYNFITKQNQTDTIHKQIKYLLDNDRANNYDLRVSKVRPNRPKQTHPCPRSRAGAPVCQRANPDVVVICYSWCRAVGFIRAAVGCACAVGLSCAVCLLATWLQVCLQDDR